MKTLLVQDKTAETVLRRCFVNRGYDVTVCESTEAAQQSWERERFLLVALELADISRVERFCSWLQRHQARKQSFVAVLVELGQIGALDRLLSVGADEILLQSHDLPAIELRFSLLERQIQQRLEWQRKEDAFNTRAQQQVAIAALGQCALTEDLATLMDLVSRFIMYTLEVEFCSVLEMCEDGQSLKFVAGFGWREGYIGQVLPRPPAESVTGRTLLGDDLVVDGLEHDSRFSAPDFLREHGVANAISVAIKGKEKHIFGVLGAYTAHPRLFVDDELRFLEGLANVLGAALERRRSDAEIQKQQSQLQHLQRLESIGQLAAGLAHDYNNVLTIIHGHITLVLGDSSLPPKAASSLRLVLEAVERAADLTRQLLSFSRKQSMEQKPIDLNNVITSVARLLDRVFGRHIQLQVNPCPGLPAVQGDSGMLDQVLMNLAVNARDAMPAGGRLTIGTSLQQVDSTAVQRHPEAREGEFVCLTVTDIGCGMDATTVRHIFDPFFTTKEPGKGTGLGLSTAYGIVKQHQGWIEVDSVPNRGTTFTIYLPSLGAGAEIVRPDSDVRPGAVGETILLVEDEAALRELARMLLEDLGHQVIEAGSGVEALKIWSQHQDKVQILMTDLVMPDDLTGFELAKRLRQQRPDLKLIFTSGYSPDHVRKQLPIAQDFQFVQKPYRLQTLAKAIRACYEPSSS